MNGAEIDAVIRGLEDIAQVEHRRYPNGGLAFEQQADAWRALHRTGDFGDSLGIPTIPTRPPADAGVTP